MKRIGIIIMTTKQISVEELGDALNATRNGDAGEKKVRAAKKTDEEKAAETLAKETKRVAREAERAANKAAKANREPAHMAKVNKAAAKLPSLTSEAEAILNEVFNQLDASAITAFIANVQHRLRAAATAASAGVKLEVGQTVRILGGDARYLGQLATVTSAQRIRVVVETEAGKSVYLLNSDVELLAQTLNATSESVTEEIAEAV